MTNPTTPTSAESIVETTARIKALAEKATPGPWRFSPWHIEEGSPAVRQRAEGWIVASTAGDSDAEYIAALDPDTVRALCDAVLAGGTDAAKPAGADGVDWKLRATTLAECLRYALDVGYDDEALDEFVNKSLNDCRDYLASFDRALAASSDTPA
jgi:hypothetical protein